MDTSPPPHSALVPGIDIGAFRALPHSGTGQIPYGGGGTPWIIRRANLVNARLAMLDFQYGILEGVDLSKADLRAARLRGTHFEPYPIEHRGTNTESKPCRLNEAQLNDANIRGVIFNSVDAAGADFRHADLNDSKLCDSDLSRANFANASFFGATIANCRLDNANFTGLAVGGTKFSGVDLSTVIGLDALGQAGSCSLDFETLVRSRGRIPDSFLELCCVPKALVASLRIGISDSQPVQYHSCFISYSHRNEDFVSRLYSRLHDEGVSAWYASEHIAGGKKIHEQLNEAIPLYDKLLIVLSQESIVSEWVKTEIRRARKREVSEKRQLLFPIRLVSMEALRDWSAFDADSGKDLATEIREYFIPDFSNWKDYDCFEKAFARLLKDLNSSVDPSRPSTVALDSASLLSYIRAEYPDLDVTPAHVAEIAENATSLGYKTIAELDAAIRPVRKLALKVKCPECRKFACDQIALALALF